MNKIQEIRKQIGLTQEEMSTKLGISQQAYGAYEKEGNNIPSKMIDKIAEILMVDPSIFLFDDELTNDSLTEFLYKSLTSFHAVRNAIKILKENGFTELDEAKEWKLEKGGKYFVTKNGSAIIAFKVGNKFLFNIATCHTDSPCLKIKGNSLLPSSEGPRINVEKYGGLINYSFMDIPLKIGGRVLVKNDKGLEQKIITSNFNVNIPSLCIHHNSTVNDGTELNVQRDMCPLLGESDSLYKALLPKEEIVDSDLFCVPFVKPTYTGVNSEFLTSPRIDNLTSLYAITKAIISTEKDNISVMFASDNEEIGSFSKQGAESSFLENVLKRITKTLRKNNDDYYNAINNGFVLSIDNGHAVHPAYSEMSDPDMRVKLNEGVVIKHHPNYATDGLSSAIVKEIASKANVEIQEYYNRSDVRCGSTTGLTTSTQLTINTCDIGLAQLAMHSGIETVGKHDIAKLIKLVKAYYETSISFDGNCITLN